VADPGPASGPPERVVLVDPDPAWPQRFAEEAARVRAAAGPPLLALEHTGSTSVPDLVAKPVIDLLGGVDRLSDADALVPKIETLGYEYVSAYESEIPRRRYFVRRRADGVRTHHLHVVEAHSWFWNDHLHFRDHLRRHAAARDAYATLKRDLAARFPQDRVAYTMAKSTFIASALAAARRERGRPHAVVVGGTGMLRGAVLGLCRRGYAVSVVARKARDLDRLVRDAAAADGVVRGVCVDYRDREAFAFGLDAAARELGPPLLAVVWAHSSAPDAPRAVAEFLDRSGRPGELFHLLGSASADPSAPDALRGARFREFPRLSSHEVVLGFIVEGDRSRWLTDDEIAAGVLRAIDDHAPRRIVGVVSPWSSRP
jgi:GrpB-like predicted nucleotidyltransferase (UPF0157 family)